MRLTSAVVLAAVVLVPAQAAAQQRRAPAQPAAGAKPPIEIGTRGGLSILANGGTVTTFSIPGDGLFGSATIYASFFSGKKWLIEPEDGLSITHGGGTTVTSWGAGVLVGQLFQGHAVKSTFLGGTVALQYNHSAVASTTNFALGAKVGYRVPVGTSVAVRVEGGYRRWLRYGGLNEITIGAAFGGLVHPK